MKFNTKVIHAGVHPDPATGAIMPPIYQTSTYVQEEIGVHKGFEYSRTGNPTRAILENNLSAIEGGKFGACFGSGLAAIDAVIKMLNPGDEVISTNDLYGGSYRIFTTIFEKYGINFHFVNMMDVNNIQEKINTNTKLIWIEIHNKNVRTINKNRTIGITKTNIEFFDKKILNISKKSFEVNKIEISLEKFNNKSIFNFDNNKKKIIFYNKKLQII